MKRLREQELFAFWELKWMEGLPAKRTPSKAGCKKAGYKVDKMIESNGSLS